MQHSWLYILTISLQAFVCSTLAQSNAVNIMGEVNQRIAGARQGYYEVNSFWKAATKSDTIVYSGGAAFFRENKVHTDSIASFVLTRDGEIKEAFDGQTYYYVSAQNRQIGLHAAADRGGILEMLEGRYRSRWAFKPFLYQDGKPSFNLSKFENATVDTLIKEGTPIVRITVLDSFVNQQRLIDSDPAMVQWREVYEVALPDYSLRRWAQTMLFWSKPQYQEIWFSPIIAWPDSITFDRTFNKDSLLAAGYHLNPIIRQVSQALPVVNLQVGDTLADFQLPGLDGDTLRVRPGTRGLLLLDFWYRACGPCIQSMPALERIHQKYKSKGVQVLGLNGHDRDAGGLRAFLSERQVTYPTLLDRDRQFSNSLNIKAYPTLLLVDRSNNKILSIEIGYLPDLEERIIAFARQLGLE